MSEDFLKLIELKERESLKNSRRAAIINPGALGDCLLTLPLAQFLRDELDLGAVDFIGHTDNIYFYPGRTPIDSIRSIESIDFHRLFFDRDSFQLEDGDRLIRTFDRYECLISLLGAGNPNFEDNLIYTVNCARPADVAVLPFEPDDKKPVHIAEYYIRRYAAERELNAEGPDDRPGKILVTPTRSDFEFGKEFHESAGFDLTCPIAIIHPGSGGLYKCWHIENFLTVAHKLIQADIQVLFMLGPAEVGIFDDRAISPTANCISGMELADILKILSPATLYIGNDSGITHLASFMGIKTLALFGPTNPEIYGPSGPDSMVYKPDIKSFDEPSPVEAEKTCEIIREFLKD